MFFINHVYQFWTNLICSGIFLVKHAEVTSAVTTCAMLLTKIFSVNRLCQAKLIVQDECVISSVQTY